ncbi:MAG: NADH-quinone oxidoreductase subunit NuoE [Brevefilum sp.]
MAVDKSSEKETIDGVSRIVNNIGSTRADLIPILQAITDEFGYISEVAITELSSLLNLPHNEIFSVATFYRMLSTQPRGKHIIQFCESAPCHVVGGKEVWEALVRALNIAPGETTPDKKWTLLTTSCLGVCGIGPVLMVDTDMYGNVKPEQVKSILSRYD